ncbi:hypothetical protein OG828_48060 [Streptomyces sp. NBC_00457]|uniref:hypothetical protein n=1 Tax=Streptomyces sp. NBC_00457 TaxID=2975748 RepID=UPI002E25053F
MAATVFAVMVLTAHKDTAARPARPAGGRLAAGKRPGAPKPGRAPRPACAALPVPWPGAPHPGR